MSRINNESRELNRYRIDTFRLRDIFCAFFSSCYLGVRKPDARIYEIALDVMQAEPATSLFVDDREENVEAARALGMPTIHVTDLRGLTEQLLNAGVEVQTPGPVSAHMYRNGGERPRRDVQEG
ncbi:MAG: HAD-IA family hydrolase [Luteitalea sp.]|nr:HAD-IA family hydrolase [Luteitalea sp.]